MIGFGETFISLSTGEHSFLPKRFPWRRWKNRFPVTVWGLILNDVHYVPHDLQQKLDWLWGRQPNLMANFYSAFDTMRRFFMGRSQ
ncbi:hypothetical protein CEXT_476341 [Caerostris extrusa]|uniref:Uncharacterized protein n=1 Tax=Caerostris extrusa TaxID=172846 RepID=A0AAV4QP88_CAEEX|nr:hypothetical protein CEXT_476341 [Caerostris extrusa]